MRALPIGLVVLGLVGIAVVGICGGNEEVKKEIIAQERATGEIAPPATSINKVVIGVLDFETIDTWTFEGGKKALMKELRRNTRVKLVDIHEEHSLSELKRNGYELAEKYKMNYQLDMILHILGRSPRISGNWKYYFSLIDLYTKKVKEVSIELKGRVPSFRGVCTKVLGRQDLNRVLRAKKKVLGIKEMAVSREVEESPKEIGDFLIHNGPKLIAEDQYSRVLELIEDLPGRRRRHIQIQTLGCFANLKGWVSDRDKGCKLGWWNLRQKLINSGDNEATPLLVIFLKDEDPWLRLYAAELLGHIGDKRALNDLRAVGENDENRKVRKYAKRAYEQISGEKF